MMFLISAIPKLFLILSIFLVATAGVFLIADSVARQNDKLWIFSTHMQQKEPATVQKTTGENANSIEDNKGGQPTISLEEAIENLDRIMLLPIKKNDNVQKQTPEEKDAQSAEDKPAAKKNTGQIAQDLSSYYGSGYSSDSGSSGSSDSSGNSQSGDASSQTGDSAIFFASAQSSAGREPSRISASPAITNSTSPTISFEFAASSCKGSFQDKSYDNMDFAFTESGNGHSYTFSSLDYASYHVFVKCADNVSGYFDFTVIPEDSFREQGGAGQS